MSWLVSWRRFMTSMSHALLAASMICGIKRQLEWQIFALTTAPSLKKTMRKQVQVLSDLSENISSVAKSRLSDCLRTRSTSTTSALGRWSSSWSRVTVSGKSMESHYIWRGRIQLHWCISAVFHEVWTMITIHVKWSRLISYIGTWMYMVFPGKPLVLYY